MGVPKRCIDPTAMSAPMAPGDSISTIDSGSATTTARPPASCTRAMIGARSRTSPEAPGLASTAPNISPGRSVAGSPTTTSMPIGSARVAMTAMVWGLQSASTKNTVESPFTARRAMVMASAAAVPSSSSEALASGSPVRSDTSVWKFSRASSRPCEISGW